MANTVRNKPGASNPQNEENQALENVTSFYDKNKKVINGVGIVILLAIVGIYGYKNMYMGPKEDKASTAIASAQRYFEQDSIDKALNGDGQTIGFLAAKKKYGGTSTANLCNYYIGVCYLKTGDFNSAIKYLKDFDGHGTKVSYAAYGALADAYMETGDVKNGIEYYNKAASDKDNDVFSALYLYRAAVAYEMNNQPDEAIKAYKKIRDDYPQSMQARNVTKDLARLGVL